MPRSRVRARSSSRREIRYLPATYNLQPTASGTWHDTGLQVGLPSAGTYILDANVQARIWGRPPVNSIIQARLVDATSRAVVGQARVIDHLVDNNAGDAGIGQRANGSISELISVTGPTTIRLEATRINLFGASTLAEIAPLGTSLRYVRV